MKRPAGAASIPDPGGVIQACYTTSLAHGNPVGSMSLTVPFSGNLLIQASGVVSLQNPADSAEEAGCQPYVDGSVIIGTDSGATVNASATVESIAITGATAISAGPHTVEIKCSTGISGETPNVILNAFAAVTGS